MTILPSRWHAFLFLLLFLFSTLVNAQINITGRVVDGENDLPLPGASVYFNNTTIGTYTNQQGNFHFDAVKLLNTELVISCAGYELLVLDKPTAEQLEGKRFIFKMKLKELHPEPICKCSGEIRKNTLRSFYRNFLGMSTEAEKCEVLNAQVIRFSSDTDGAVLRYYADTPLVIINKLLGYKLSINLVEFAFERGQHYVQAYTRYDELSNGEATIGNRKRNYYGSTLHFYRSLITHQLHGQGFNTFVIKPPADSLSERLYKSGLITPVHDDMNALPITAQQILYIDSTNNFSINITGWLLVQYEKEPALKKRLKQNNFMEGYLRKGVESYVFFKYAPISINRYGVLGNYENVSYTGYWIYEKAANLLPYNFEP